MAWTWDAAKRRYTDGERVLSERDLLALRNAVADGMAEESVALAQRLVDGGFTLADWAEAFSDLIRAGTSAGFVLGRGGAAQLDRAAFDLLEQLILDQLGFAKGFAAELAPALDAGTATAEGVAARSALYAGAGVQAFDRGRGQAWGLDLPYFPADGLTACHGNCRCEWSIEELEDRIEATWHVVGDEASCDGCIARGNQYGPGSPFTQAKQVGLGL